MPLASSPFRGRIAASSAIGIARPFGAVARCRTTSIGAIAAAVAAATIFAVLALPSIAQASVTVRVPCTGPGGGASGLVAAVQRANADGGGTINLAPGCTYTLTAPATAGGQNGLPTVVASIRVNGAGATVERAASSTELFRIFDIASNGHLTLNVLTVSGGKVSCPNGCSPDNSPDNIEASGGGIANDGTLELNASRVTHNSATVPGGGFVAEGGGIFNAESAKSTLRASEVTDNTVTPANASSVGLGGGIDNEGTFSLLASQVQDNASTGGDSAAGGIGNQNGGTFDLTASRVEGNRIDTAEGLARGAGVGNFNATLVLNASRVDGNVNTGPIPQGGGIYTAGNSAGPGPATTRLNATSVEDNRAVSNQPSGMAAGGGIYHSGTADAGSIVLLRASRVANNSPDNCAPTGSVPGCSG